MYNIYNIYKDIKMDGEECFTRLVRVMVNWILHVILTRKKLIIIVVNEILVNGKFMCSSYWWLRSCFVDELNMREPLVQSTWLICVMNIYHYYLLHSKCVIQMYSI